MFRAVPRQRPALESPRARRGDARRQGRLDVHVRRSHQRVPERRQGRRLSPRDGGSERDPAPTCHGPGPRMARATAAPTLAGREPTASKTQTTTTSPSAFAAACSATSWASAWRARSASTTTVRGYMSLWSTVESLGRDKWSPLHGRGARGLLHRDRPLGQRHRGQDAGLAGTDVVRDRRRVRSRLRARSPLHRLARPGVRSHRDRRPLSGLFGAGISYSTPSLGGLQLHVGLYDPVVFSTSPERLVARQFRAPGGRASRFDRPLGVHQPDQDRRRGALPAGVAHRHRCRDGASEPGHDVDLGRVGRRARRDRARCASASPASGARALASSTRCNARRRREDESAALTSCGPSPASTARRRSSSASSSSAAATA